MARVFIYDGREFPDPDPNLSPEQVKTMMADFFPELANAEIRERQQGEDTLYDLVRKVGVKGQGPDPKHYMIEVQLTNWISTNVLAAAIMEALTEDGIPVRVMNARQVWLDFLGKELVEGLERAARATRSAAGTRGKL